MLPRIRNGLGFALLLALIFVIPAFAGGWAVITLDQLPSNIVAGEPFTVGFTVMQHGKTPMDGLYPTITAKLFKDQEIVFNAEPEGKPGHYTATVTLPKEGEWQWSIQAFTMDQAMPILSVAPATNTASSPTAGEAGSAISPMLLVGGFAIAVGLVGVVIAFRRRTRWVTALTVISLLAGISLLIAEADAASGTEAQAKSISETANDSSLSQVEMGRQLFIAKGCITCHYNSKAANSSEYWTIEMGAPNLSTFSANPEVIHMRLKDPSSVKSDTKMPTLNLSESEIEALVAFINSK